MHPRLGPLRQTIYILFILTLITVSLRLLFAAYLKCSSCPVLSSSSTSMIFYNKSLMIEDEKTSIDDTSILCLAMGHYLDSEQYLPQSPIISAPLFDSLRLFRFPYRYSYWNSSSKLPRLLTPCEHNLLMHLLIIIDRICRQHEIIYFIIEGALLGSLRHHDIIPWDDDIDLMMPYKQQKLFFNAFHQINQTLTELYTIHRKIKSERHYKMFYKTSPNARKFDWHFPFIDIFFYTQNETHLWNLAYPKTTWTIWVPTPGKPHRIFHLNVFDECISHYWDHRKEIPKKKLKMKCNDLKEIYPFIEHNNKTNFIEILKVSDTIIHTVIFK